MVSKSEKHNFGWTFPVNIDESTGRIKTASYEEDIQQSIKIILMTRKGERMMMPTFGCNIHNHVFDIINFSVLRQMESEVKEALEIWESRIENINVDVKEDEGKRGQLIINIKYIIKATRKATSSMYRYTVNE